MFREARPTEKNVVDAEGKEMTGMQGIRAGLQELGPRMFPNPDLPNVRRRLTYSRDDSETPQSRQGSWKSRQRGNRRDKMGVEGKDAEDEDAVQPLSVNTAMPIRAGRW